MLYMIPTISMDSPLLAWAHLGEPAKESGTKFRYALSSLTMCLQLQSRVSSRREHALGPVSNQAFG